MGALVSAVVETASLLSFFPSIYAAEKHGEPFQVFLLIISMFASIMFEICRVFSVTIFLHQRQWHFIAETLFLSSAFTLFIAMAQLSEEYRRNLSYFAFFATWLTKTRDSWDSVLCESILGLSIAAGCVVEVTILHPRKMNNFKMDFLARGAIAGAICGFCVFMAELLLGGEDTTEGSFVLILAHLSGAFAFFHLWLCCVPPRGLKNSPSFV